ncbi:AAA family ATPase [Tissierella sp. MB52-C2]|uniref:AAA family ATPase n=1 Tax=Tissierella sp. MB52-C2 TaxID=3070999 RepID=UPI00280AAEED|nr:AAA family ATPase [Tissierella sp. MB52-C2]WMM26031.1 AAA family ATPase [Tissierella sp. MB52-C2]
MGVSLTDIAKQLKDNDKKVQLIYAFNGTGKTRLSREFKLLVEPKVDGEMELVESEVVSKKILYYNAFTEDLFYWDNDLENDTEPKLKIHPNSFTRWIFEEQGQDRNIISHFQHYTDEKLTPHFNEEYAIIDKNGENISVGAFTEVTFSYERGNDERSNNIKISKGEESNFVWCVFYSLLEQVIDVLNVAEPSGRETNQFDQMKYIFIDDPVTSLDDNHLMQLAVDLAQLIKKNDFESGLKFIITTHNPIFYNVLHNELKSKTCYMLGRQEDGTFELQEKRGDSNKSFSYHLHLKKTIEEAIENNQVERYHFTLLRNLYEKTASFLGFPKWSELLPGNKESYYNRIIQFTSHSTLSDESVAEPSPQEKQTVRLLLEHLISNYSFWKEA